MESKCYNEYLNILQEELVPALGCTEPIAIAYAAAEARDILGKMPERVRIHCSGNIIKNVKCVVVPNTSGLIGIEAGALAGIVGGRAENKMEVLSGIGSGQVSEIKRLLAANICEVTALNSDCALHIILELSHGIETVKVEVRDYHTNIVKKEKNGEVLFEKNSSSVAGFAYTDRSVLNVNDIVNFAQTVEISEVKELMERQIEYNMAIAQEGLNGGYGIDIGNTILKYGEKTTFNMIKAYTSAASEARMVGCELAVITNSGSGNQGIAASVPAIIYAREKEIGHEKLLRALVLSNLLAIHQKTPIGRLSAFCGVVSASCASGAAITFLAGGTTEQIKMTVTNTLANVSGIICDGAKASCGIKIAASLDAAILAHLLAMDNKVYHAGDGMVKKDVEATISSVGRIARDGMKETDKEILKVMLEN